jgi:N-acetylmuramoyl-L-alanine amidase
VWLALLACVLGGAALQGRTFNGEAYVPLSRVAAQLGMDLRAGSDGKSATLKSKWTTVSLEKDGRSVQLNGVLIHLGAPIVVDGGSFYISETDLRTAIQSLLTPQLFGRPPGLRLIVIDAGHGGKDTGAQNSALKLQEKHLALDMARRLARVLQARGYQVRLTRTGDEFIELDDRPAIANRLGADLFISVHANASTTASVRGVETYILPPAGHASTSGSGRTDSVLPGNANDAWNALIGYYVQRELVNQLHANDRGLKRARFAVLRPLRCPGLLVETGFVSNPTEGRNLGWDAYRQKVVEALADAVDAYQKTLVRVAAQTK